MKQRGVDLAMTKDAGSVVEALAAKWRSCGVHEGEVLLIHSSLRRLLGTIHTDFATKASPSLVMASLLYALGKEGTLILPTFNFDFTSGVSFDIRTTRSQMGSLSEVGRTHPGAVRTGHPVYSFAVIGSRQEDFRGIENKSGYGADSPFALLHKLGGRIGIIDLPDQNSMTAYHYIEEFHDVPYRYHKNFSGNYTDRNGVTCCREFSIFVRDIEKGVETDVNRMGQRLWDKGLYKGDLVGQGLGLRTILMKDLFEEVSSVISGGFARDFLFSISGSGSK